MSRWRWDEQSFTGNSATHWAILNWISVCAWVFVCLTVLVGKGKPRLPLCVWCLTMPLLTFTCMLMGFNY